MVGSRGIIACNLQMTPSRKYVETREWLGQCTFIGEMKRGIVNSEEKGLSSGGKAQIYLSRCEKM